MDGILNFDRRHIVASPTDIIGSSDCNKYTPVIGLFVHDLISFGKDKKIIEYYLPSASSSTSHRSYNRLIDDFIGNYRVSKFIYKVGDITKDLYVHRGIIYDEDYNVLIALAVDSEYLLETSPAVFMTGLNMSKMYLFMSTELDQDIYKNLKKNFTNKYIEPAKALGLDVVYTTRIKHWLFSNNFTPPKFKSLSESIEHLSVAVSAMI